MSDTAPAAPAAIDDGTRRQALLGYLQDRGNPNALLGLASTLQSAAPADTGYPAPAAAAASTGRMRPAAGKGGASAALAWIGSKVGDPSSKETGTNSGGLASYANKRFGLSNAPWCAMFTSLAVTKGGAPASARTASVAQVRAKAQAGGQGYVKGIFKGSQARPGDLILFGNEHIAMVESNHGGKITYVGGNQSDNVTRQTVSANSGVDVVRPAYR